MEPHLGPSDRLSAWHFAGRGLAAAPGGEEHFNGPVQIPAIRAIAYGMNKLSCATQLSDRSGTNYSYRHRNLNRPRRVLLASYRRGAHVYARFATGDFGHSFGGFQNDRGLRRRDTVPPQKTLSPPHLVGQIDHGRSGTKRVRGEANWPANSLHGRGACSPGHDSAVALVAHAHLRRAVRGSQSRDL